MRSFIIRFLYLGIWTGIIYVALKYAMPLFMPFVIAFLLAFLLNPLINLITKKTRLGRKPVSVVVLVLVFAIAGTLLTLAGVKLVVQIGSWLAELPRLYRSYVEPAVTDVSTAFDSIIGKLDPSVQRYLEMTSDSISDTVTSLLGSISSGAINLLTGTASRVPWTVVSIFLAILASFFFVVDYEKITSTIFSQFSANAVRKMGIIKDFVVNVLFKFARAYLIIMTVTFTEVAVGLLILRVPNALGIALITAIADILPVLGTGTIMIPWAAYSLFVGDFGLAIGLGILYAIITIVRQFLEPRVVGKQIGLYPLLTLIGMFIGARLFGFWGMFGFPIAMTVLIHLNRAGEITIFKDTAGSAPAPVPAPTANKPDDGGTP